MEASAAGGPHVPGPGFPPGCSRLASDDRLVEPTSAAAPSAAFEALFDRHHRGILAFCRHMLGSPEEAEDAVQHTFMAAYRELTARDKPIQLRAWLYTIARNRCLSVLRARRERPLDDARRAADREPLRRGPAPPGPARPAPRPGGLPEQQRAALVLAEVGDVSHEEIAAMLDVPREKVKALVFQARSSLIASRRPARRDCEDIREQLVELKRRRRCGATRCGAT